MNKFFALMGLAAIAVAAESDLSPVATAETELTKYTAETAAYKYCGYTCKSRYSRMKRLVKRTLIIGRSYRCRRSYKCRVAVRNLKRKWANIQRKWQARFGYHAAQSNRRLRCYRRSNGRYKCYWSRYQAAYHQRQMRGGHHAQSNRRYKCKYSWWRRRYVCRWRN